MQFSRALTILGLTAMFAPLAGCIVTADDSSTPVATSTIGTLTVAYTIEGTTDPNACLDYNVSDVELVIHDDSGAYVAEREVPCTDFEVRIGLAPGRYTADVTLVDSADGARSVTKPLDAVDVIADTDLVIDLDFPPDSML